MSAMKRTWLLLVLFLSMGAAAYYALQRNTVKKAGSNLQPDMDFAIRDTSIVHKIFLADRKGRTTTLIRQTDGWLYNNKYLARQSAVQMLLETMQKVRVAYIPPVNAEQMMVQSIAAEGIKVEAYDKNNELLKVYYVGGVTNDEHGTYMMMEGSEHPYVTHVPSLSGGLRVNYRFGDEDWMDRNVFREKPELIQQITVEYPQQKNESFKLEKTGTAEFSISPFYSTTPPSTLPQRKGVAEAYLLAFEKLGAEVFANDYHKLDSITALVPFAIVTLTNTDGREKKVQFWTFEEVKDRSGKTLTYRYFVKSSWEQHYITQQLVFGPIFRGYSYFFTGKNNTTLLQ
jgi:Domain of unknown function (DUF4340)